jgi:hypothetical protein
MTAPFSFIITKIIVKIKRIGFLDARTDAAASGRPGLAMLAEEVPGRRC